MALTSTRCAQCEEAHRLPVANSELLAIEHALRRREAEWARRRLVAEQLHWAKEAVQRQTKNWDDTGHRNCQLQPGLTTEHL